MTSMKKIINKLFDEAFADKWVVSLRDNTTKVLRECEEKGKLVQHDGCYIASVRTKIDKNPAIRMIFAIKEDSDTRIQNIERITSIMNEVEETLIFVDKHETDWAEGFIYLDVVKKLKEVSDGSRC